ncbi:ROK family protein [Palleronia sp. LCG004]|uniref:ROK family protein n=1 Tax=Palleronia sp. LCG004 TaxID=3079304 RepID=UPI002942CA61|nr:ROK family protein [Palleronia sp. LCG004]WOI57622.1 ROK family protein [Palleronia sp. LCG004]
MPLQPCGCGADGCLETYISGTGLSNLAEIRTGHHRTAEEIVADPDMAGTLEIWADLTGECLSILQLAVAPDIVVLGGGLSNIPGVENRLSAALATRRLGDAAMPSIAIARHGDSSGARGAALIAAVG